MVRVVSNQAVLRILFVSAGLLVAGAGAQQADKNPAAKPTNDAAAAQAQPAAAQTEAAPAKPAPDAVDPLKRPTNEKPSRPTRRSSGLELSRRNKKWLID